MAKAVAPCGSDFDDLVSLVLRLRGDRGCPWDRVQTPETIKIYLIEEAYEVLEALEAGEHKAVCAELGDLLFHIVFLATIFEEEGAFTAKDVIQTITEKMIRRHPHVFGEARVSSAQEVRQQWHQIKVGEAKDKDEARTCFLDSIPQRLPALMRVHRLAQRASMVGFDWPDVHSVLMKLEEGLRELKAALKGDDAEKTAEEFGDLLFDMANLGRCIGVHPETALTKAISRFVTRFNVFEESLRQQGRSLESASREEMAEIWGALRKERRRQ